MAEAALRYRRLEQEVWQLKRTLAVNSRSAPNLSVMAEHSFTRMAGAVMRREEQLQQARAHIRTQRVHSEEAMRRLQKQLEAHNPGKHVRAALERMHQQSIRTAQNVEYRAEVLRQERARLLELAMQAFCKVGYELNVGGTHTAAPRYLGERPPLASLGPTAGHFHSLLHGTLEDRPPARGTQTHFLAPGAPELTNAELLAKVAPSISPATLRSVDSSGPAVLPLSQPTTTE